MGALSTRTCETLCERPSGMSFICVFIGLHVGQVPTLNRLSQRRLGLQRRLGWRRGLDWRFRLASWVCSRS